MTSNKTTVLSNGYIEPLLMFPSIEEIRGLLKGFAVVDCDVPQIANAYIVFHAPIVVKLAMGSSGLKQYNSANATTMEVMEVNVSHFSAKDLKLREEFAQYINYTGNTCITSIIGLIKDNCDSAIAELIATLSTYNTYVAQGTLREWLLFINRPTQSPIIAAYQQAAKEVLKAQWPMTGIGLWEKNNEGQTKRSRLRGSRENDNIHLPD